MGVSRNQTLGALPEEIDIVVIGAGIMGLFSALFLAQRGQRVVVIDRGVPWAEASAVNAGSLGVQNKIPPLIPFALEALRQWTAMHERLGSDVGFHNIGGIRIATSGSERDMLYRGMKEQAEAGVRVDWLEGDELRRRAPFLSGGVLAASFSPDDSYAAPMLVGPALMRAMAAHHVTVLAGVTLAGVIGQAPWRLDTSRGELRCAQVVIAAGAWSARVAALFGVHLPMTLDVNMVSVTEPSRPMLPWMVTHVRGILTLKQASNGTCLIGGGWQGSGDLDSERKEVEYESSLHNIRLAVGVAPALERLSLLRQWAGFEGVAPDALPYFGELPRRDGLYISAAVRGGFTLGPVFGRLMSELILDGQCSFPVDDFAPGRFGNDVGTPHTRH